MEDYGDAAVRHFADATLLRTAQRYDNAGHLIGFAAECAIKHRIGIAVPNGSKHYEHLPQILSAARKHLGPRTRNSAMYAFLKDQDLFRTWAVDRRYWCTGTTLESELEEWFNTTRRLLATASLKHRKDR